MIAAEITQTSLMGPTKIRTDRHFGASLSTLLDQEGLVAASINQGRRVFGAPVQSASGCERLGRLSSWCCLWTPC